MIGWLKDEWSQLALKFTHNTSIIETLWREIEEQYTLKIRYYHNLSHINNMLLQAKSIKESITDHDSFLFAIWYHDIIYNPTKNNNEEKSANFSKKSTKQLNIDEKSIKIIKNLIISTKKHEIILSNNDDNSFLLDLDLSILGADWNMYQNYIQGIRKEYAIYPNFIYNRERKKVLQHFLDRKTLFFTELYKENFETQARKNLKKEFDLL